MKKIISVLLVMILCISVVTPIASAYMSSNYKSTIPAILITGDGEPIYDEDGNEVFCIDDFSSVFSGSSDDTMDAVINILKPMLLEGVLQNKWDNYYDAFYDEISDMFEDVMLDNNGEVSNGTGIAQKRIDENKYSMTHDRKDSSGKYSFGGYHFWYDWRLDPVEIADQLHDYIEAVKKVTGQDEVILTSRCIGTNVVLAYMEKYGSDSIHGWGIDGSTTYGAEFVSGVISGKFKLDGNAISRFVQDCEMKYDYFDVDEFVVETIDMLENTGALDTMTAVARETLYKKIEYGVISAIARATFLTMPCYWALVTEEDYETAKNYVFGKEGDEKRTTYAGLIEKIDNYHYNIRDNILSIMKDVSENNTNMCIVAKYGYQIIPITSDCDLVSDEYASVARASFGATTSTIYDTLSDEYIAKQEAASLGKYISPDKQIDASTCLFPDYTYFVKGADHSNWTKVENDIIMRTISADTQLTVDDLGYTQFVVAHENDDDWEVMTTENCNTENWTADKELDHPTTFFGKVKAFFTSINKWIKSLFSFVKRMIEAKKASA